MTIPSRLSRCILILFTLLLACIATPATAQTVRCVSDMAQFNAAWAQARHERVDIQMITGHWNLTGSAVDPDSPAFIDITHIVTLSGGYGSDCTSRDEDPEATVLTGSHLQFGNVVEVPRITFERVSFRDMQKLEIFANTYLTLNRVRIDQVDHTYVHARNTHVRNSLITRSGSGVAPQPTLCALEIDTFNLHMARLEHNTIADNGGRAAVCLQRMDAPETDYWTLTTQSNVLWDNATTFFLRKRDSVPAIAVHSFHNTMSGGYNTNRPLSGPNESPLPFDPQFIDPAQGDYRLGEGSPAINSGRAASTLAGSSDFRGQARWIGTAPDRGAFESNIGAPINDIVVTNSNDSGAGSLRQALTQANALPDFNRIRFNIPGACPRVITLASLLPTITQPVTIDGFSQPGASRNTSATGNNATVCVVINGNNQLTGTHGLNVATTASPDATVSIEGLGFSGHSISAVQFAGGRDHRLVGAQVGGMFGSYTALPSGTGVRIAGSTERVQIGGPEPRDRNVVAHTLGHGISITGAGAVHPVDALIQNNYIGTLTGGDVRGNHVGIRIGGGTGHLVRDNVISNNASHGVEISGNQAVNNHIVDNRIGLPALCFGACANHGNGGHGVRIANGADGNRVEGNLIALSGGDGVAVVNAQRNTVRRNRFQSNTGLGIDLGDNGIDFSDGNNANPPATVANGGQNKPILSAVEGSGGSAQASGTLASANGWYRIDFYAVPQCTPVMIGTIPLGSWGQGQDWLGSTFAQITDGVAGVSNGSTTFSGTALSAPASSSGYFDTARWVTATATRLAGSPQPFAWHLGTSEFSRCRSSTQAAPGAGIFSDGFEAP